MENIQKYIAEKLQLTNKLAHSQNPKLDPNKKLISLSNDNNEEYFDYRNYDDNKYCYTIGIDISKPYLVYRDKYNSNLMHISYVGDMLAMIALFVDDFEDMSAKDIIVQCETEDELRNEIKYLLDNGTHYRDFVDKDYFIENFLNDKDHIYVQEIETQQDLDEFIDEYID